MAENKRSANAAAPEAAPVPFEQSLEELEAVVRQLEGAEVPLEQALELFERGMKLRESCRKQLTDAETRVEILMKRAQSITAEPFEPEEE